MPVTGRAETVHMAGRSRVTLVLSLANVSSFTLVCNVTDFSITSPSALCNFVRDEIICSAECLRVMARVKTKVNVTCRALMSRNCYLCSQCL